MMSDSERFVNPDSVQPSAPLQELQPEMQELNAQGMEEVQGGILIGLSKPMLGGTGIPGNPVMPAMGDGSVMPINEFRGGV